MITARGSRVRSLEHAELIAAEPLLAEWLIGEPGHSLLRTYPQVFDPNAGTTSFGVFDDADRLVSHAAVRRVRATTSPGPVEVSLVGIVATDPKARGSHLASTLLHFIADREVAAHRDAILLWTDQWDFYGKLGYSVAGMQAEVIFTPFDVEVDYRASTPDDLPRLTELHAAKPWRIERDRAEMQRLIEGTYCDTFVLEREGEVVAYACQGKGVDMRGWWHEFGGADRDIAPLLSVATRQLALAQATILIPPYRGDLLDLVSPHATEIREGAVALVKPLTERGRNEFFVDGLDSV